MTSLSGDCCTYGYSNSATSVTYSPSIEILLAGLEVIRPTILERLRDAALICADK